MMDKDEYEDYLVDRAKEILNEEITETGEEDIRAPEMSKVEDRPGSSSSGSPESFKKRRQMDEAENSKEFSGRRNSSNFEKAEKDSTSKIPFSWDPREIKHLTRNREKMSNKELKEFMERDSEFQEKMEKIDKWKGFSRWEERLMVQQHTAKTVEEISDELDRDPREVELKMHMMGLKVEIDE